MQRTSAGKTARTWRDALGSLVVDVASLVFIGLVLLGVGGIVYHLLKPSGWLADLLDQMWSKSPSLVWLVGFASALVAANWLYRRPRRPQDSDLLVYTLLALGVFFLFKLMVTGTF